MLHKEDPTDEETEEENERREKLLRLGVDITSSVDLLKEDEEDRLRRLNPIVERDMSPYLDRYGPLKSQLYNHSKDQYFYKDFVNETFIDPSQLPEEYRAKLPKNGSFIIKMKHKEDLDPNRDHVLGIMDQYLIAPMYLCYSDYDPDDLPMPIKQITKIKKSFLQQQRKLLQYYNPRFKEFPTEEERVDQFEEFADGFKAMKNFSDDHL
jgi:hypothetical protein